jgi:hypothetical protein
MRAIPVVAAEATGARLSTPFYLALLAEARAVIGVMVSKETSVLTRDRHAIVAMGEGVGMSQIPAVRERTLGSSGRLIRIGTFPKD